MSSTSLEPRSTGARARRADTHLFRRATSLTRTTWPGCSPSPSRVDVIVLIEGGWPSPARVDVFDVARTTLDGCPCSARRYSPLPPRDVLDAHDVALVLPIAL